MLVNIDWNQPVTLNENKERISWLIRHLNTPYILSTEDIGEQQYALLNNKQSVSETSIFFNAGNSERLQQLRKDILNRLKSRYPEAIVYFKPAESIFQLMFSETNSPLIAKVRPIHSLLPNVSKLQQIVDTITQITGGKDLPVLPVKPYYLLRPNPERMLIYNIDYSHLVKKLQVLFGYLKIGKINRGNKTIDILIRAKQRDFQTIMHYEKIKTTDGNFIPLKSIVAYSRQNRMDRLLADKQGVYFPVFIKAGFSNYRTLMKKTENYMKTKSAYSLSWEGSIFDSYRLFYEFIIILVISVMLLYFILAAQFESLIQPFIVLTEIVFDITGALLVLFVFHVSFNIMSAIGIVVMGGIVINDSILKIDTINQLRKKGLPLKEAVLEGGIRRFKPIVMTSLTTILALVPLLFFGGPGVDLQLPLALSVIGGLSIGTMASLYFAPLVYYLFYQKKTIK